jgi:NADH oxidase (H2O-forming)
MSQQQILHVSNSVQWIGVLDPNLITFDIVMETRYGTTYNAYLIDAEKIAIIETVKTSFFQEFASKIKQLCDPTRIEYIILDHTEPDHSGSLSQLLEIAPQATVVGSGQALNYLQEMNAGSFKSLKVKDGDILSLGNKTLQFIGAPNLHWPDSIYTYLVEDRILFTCDSFGAHFCQEAMFDDKVGNYDHAFKYYFDVILKPFSKFMLKAIEKIKPLEIAAICPGHGPILRANWKKAIEYSERMALEYMEHVNSGKNKVLISYVSAYGYTRDMAVSIARGIEQTCDASIEMLDLEKISLGELEEKVVGTQALLVGSPTINQNTLLPVYNLFSVINPIRDKGKLAGSFGSYGWSGEAVSMIDSHLKNLKFDVPMEGVAVKFYPYGNKSESFVEFGNQFGSLVKARQQSDSAE